MAGKFLILLWTWCLIFGVLFQGITGSYIYHRKNVMCPRNLAKRPKMQCGIGGVSCRIGQICCFNGRGTTCVCPSHQKATFCSTKPCDAIVCPEFPAAKCVNDNCGGCWARFLMSDILEVTEACKAKPR